MPLWWAAKNGHEAVVKLLVETGKVEADLNDGSGWMLLYRAAENGYELFLCLSSSLIRSLKALELEPVTLILYSIVLQQHHFCPVRLLPGAF